MPSFDELKKNLSNDKNTESQQVSKSAIVKVSKKDKTIIEVEDDTLEGAVSEALRYFKTNDRNNLKMKIKQKGSKGIFGVGKKKFKVFFKLVEGTSQSNLSRDGEVKIHVRKDGVYIKVRQGENGGKILNEDYVARLLSERKIREYDINKIRESVENKNDEWVKVSDPVRTNPEWNSKPQVNISQDKMKATLVLSPPILNGKIVEKDEAMEFLKSKGVTYGINEDKIDEAIEECIYNKPIIVAEGKEAVDGEDAYIDFKFKTNPEKDIEFKEDQSGKVDYFNITGLIQNVVEDQVLAVKVPATRGRAGMNVLSETIEAKDGEDIELPCGKNTKASDNGMEVISMMHGQALYDNGLILVEPVYTVKGNVGLKTGKIVFLGTVIVSGDVEDGFGVKATQNVEIGGTVGRCEIEAEGNIVIKGGIQGKSTIHSHEDKEYETEDREKEPEGFVKAGKSVYAKFINGSIVRAQKDVVVTDAIYHSKVTAGERVVCIGRKGRIVGGKIVASKEINAKEIGSRNSYTLTEVEVGTDPDAKEKFISFDQELKEKENTIKKLKQNIDQLNKQREQYKGSLPEDKEVMLHKMMMSLNENITVADELKEDIADLKTYLDDIKTSGKLCVKEFIYPGVQLTIKDHNKKIDRENQYVTYILEAGEIRDIQYQEVDKDIQEKVSKEVNRKNNSKKTK